MMRAQQHMIFRLLPGMLLTLLPGAWPAGPAAAEICAVTLTGAMQASIVVTDTSGVSSPGMPVQGHLSVAPVRGVDAVILAEDIYKFSFPDDGQYRLSWQQRDDPSSVTVKCADGPVRTLMRVYDAVFTGAGFATELVLAPNSDPALSVDSDGNGDIDTVVPPDIAVQGDGAADTEPPVITHTRLPDGRHALTLLDTEQDITTSGQLLYSLGDGSGYTKYTGPIELDTRSSPRLLAIGRDLAGNRSDQYGFMTRGEQAPLCERLDTERDTVRTAISASLQAAIADGLIAPDHGISMVSTGPGACLWKRDAQGNDVACATCEGRYAPVFDTQRILVLFPDAVSTGVREQLLDRLRTSAALPQHDRSELAFSSSDRAAFESGQRAAADGLAGQMQLLEWLLQGEYVDLGGSGPGVTGASLDDALDALSNAGIPRLEGYEYSLVAERELLDTDLLVRIVAMHEGTVPVLPQLDPHFGRLLRNQLETAAATALRTAFGRLVTDDCALQADLVLTDRAAFAASACAGGPCTSFTAYSMARATSAAQQCPGLFSGTELDDLSGLAAIAARDVDTLIGTFTDECAANRLLAAALRFIRDGQSALQPGYSTLMQALADGNPDEHGIRQANADAARTRIGNTLAAPAVNLKLAIVNTGSNESTGVTVTLYDNGSPTGQQVSLDTEGGFVEPVTGDHENNQPFFVRIDPAVVDPNEVRSAAVLLQTPGVENAASDAETFGTLQYYLFDPDEPVCPNPTRVERPDEGGGG